MTKRQKVYEYLLLPLNQLLKDARVRPGTGKILRVESVGYDDPHDSQLHVTLVDRAGLRERVSLTSFATYTLLDRVDYTVIGGYRDNPRAQTSPKRKHRRPDVYEQLRRKEDAQSPCSDSENSPTCFAAGED